MHPIIVEAIATADYQQRLADAAEHRSATAVMGPVDRRQRSASPWRRALARAAVRTAERLDASAVRAAGRVA